MSADRRSAEVPLVVAGANPRVGRVRELVGWRCEAEGRCRIGAAGRHARGASGSRGAALERAAGETEGATRGRLVRSAAVMLNHELVCALPASSASQSPRKEAATEGGRCGGDAM